VSAPKPAWDAREALLLVSASPCQLCVIGDAWHYHSPGCPIGLALGHLSDDDQVRINAERLVAMKRWRSE
jgi:hypothetical protein